MIDIIYFLAMLIFFVILFKSAKHLMDNKKEVPAPQPIKQNTTHHHPKTSPVPMQKKRTYTSYADKVKKGKEYEALISKLFRCRGYTVLEHGKLKGKKDGGIDIVATKENETILIQCKDWKKSSTYRIREDELKKFRTDCRDFIRDNMEYKSTKTQLLYVLAEDCVHKSAKYHLEERKAKGDKIDIEIIPIFNAEKEIKESLDVIIEDRKKCPKCNQGYLVPRTLKNKKYQGKHKQENFLGCSRFPKCKYSEDMT